jgi:hypothetical protein
MEGYDMKIRHRSEGFYQNPHPLHHHQQQHQVNRVTHPYSNGNCASSTRVPHSSNNISLSAFSSASSRGSGKLDNISKSNVSNSSSCIVGQPIRGNSGCSRSTSSGTICSRNSSSTSTSTHTTSSSCSGGVFGGGGGGTSRIENVQGSRDKSPCRHPTSTSTSLSMTSVIVENFSSLAVTSQTSQNQQAQQNG